MPPFPTLPTTISTLLSLETVIARLAAQDALEGVLLLGTTGSGALTPRSDYDVLVVTAAPTPLWHVLTTVDGRLTEVYVVPMAEIAALGAMIPFVAHTDSRPALLARWLLRGRIVADRSGRLAHAHAQLQTGGYRFTVWSEAELYRYWFKINYDLRETERLLPAADDPVRATTIDMRLLYCLPEVWVSYFRFRGLPWDGDKAAIAYLTQHDPAFLAAFRACHATSDLRQRLTCYRDLAAQATAPVGGLWRAEVGGIQLADNTAWSLETLRWGLSLWDMWIQ